MKKFITIFKFSLLLVFLSNCSNQNTPSNYPITNAISPVRNISQDSCLATYNRLSSSGICYNYYNNINSQCDSIYKDILKSRGSDIFPRDKCGVVTDTTKFNLSDKSACNIDFRNQATYSNSQLCSFIHSSQESQCKPKMVEELLNTRKVEVYPQSKCGIAKITSSTSSDCMTDFSNQNAYPTGQLCNFIHSNQLSQCKTKMIDELISNRKLKPFPKETCGNSFLSQPKSDAPKQCNKLISRINSSNDPIKFSCEYRYKSLEKESIICRKYLTEAITSRGRKVGSSFESCGIK